MEPELVILPADPPQPKPAKRIRRTNGAEDSATVAGNPEWIGVQETEEPEFHPPEETEFAEVESFPGFTVEPAAAANRRPVIQVPEKEKEFGEPKSGPPSLDEWQDFFSRIVLRAGTEFMVSVMLGDVMDQLTPHERKLIELSSEDLREMSAPFASLANKSKKARKHGRFIISAADSVESVLSLAIWLRRVNRISRKYRPARAQRRQQQHQHQPQQPMEGIVITEGNGNGRIVGANGGTGQDAGPRFGVYNPGTG
jgi:hypothetical protein